MFNAANLFKAVQGVAMAAQAASAVMSYQASKEAADLAKRAGEDRARNQRDQAEDLKRGNVARWVANGYDFKKEGDNGTLDDLNADIDSELNRDLRVIDLNTGNTVKTHKTQAWASLAGGFSNSVAMGKEMY